MRFDVESREYMERWYTDVTAYSVSKVDKTAAAAPEADPFAGKAPYVEGGAASAPSTGFQPLVTTLTTYLSKSYLCIVCARHSS